MILMKKHALGTTIAILSIIVLQIYWLSRVQQFYLSEFTEKMELHFDRAVDQEAWLRKINLHKDLLQDSNKSIHSDDIKEMVGDSTLLATIKKEMGISSASDGVNKMFQMLLIRQGIYPHLNSIDSIYRQGMSERADHCILLYRQGRVIDYFGDTTLVSSSRRLTTSLKPIGTQNEFFICLLSERPSTEIFHQMTYAIFLSGTLALLVVGCLVWQYFVILRKEQLLKQRETAVNGIVHDLKTPLAGVTTLVGWLKKEERDGQKKAFLQQAEGRLQRLRSDIESILTAARGGDREIVLCKEFVCLPTLLAQAAADMKACLPTKRHTLETDNRLANGKVEADPACLRNVFAQLLENALKYSDEGVHITVRLEEADEGWITVSVADNGWGIPRKCLKKLFEEYYQVPRAEGRAQKGYGIGLTYARYIIRAHGGDIRVESREGMGSTFSIRLPQKTSIQ